MERLTVRNDEGIGVLKHPFECVRCGDICYSLPDLGDGSPTDRLAEYEDIGLLPEQILAIDKLYTEKCEELAKIQKEYLSGKELAQIYAKLRKIKEYENIGTVEDFKNALQNVKTLSTLYEKLNSQEVEEYHKLTEYEDLEKKGRLMKLPYAVGNTYFEIQKAFWIDERMCSGCRYYYNCCIFEDHEENEGKIPSCTEIVEKKFESVKEIVSCMEDGAIGKTVFSTHEEAKAALKELRGE